MASLARSRVLPIALAVPVGLGCARAPETGPPPVHYGQDVCAACNMIVSEEDFASAVVTRSDGEVSARLFDDLGCLFGWTERNPDAEVLARWVRTPAGADWIAADSAFYVRSAAIRSPMGSGVAAYGTVAEAEGVARECDGELHDWSGLSDLAAREGLLAPPLRSGDSRPGEER